MQRVLVLTLVWLFAIPAATLAFTHYALHAEDTAFLDSVDTRLAEDGRRTAEEKTAVAAFYRSHPLSAACGAHAEADRAFHDRVCPPWGFQWQFHWAERTAFWTLVYGVALLATALALGALAFADRSLRTASFVAGWRLMTWSSAAEILLQGAMLVWLSFWLTAYFWERYYVKLVVIAGFMAAAAVGTAIYAMFKQREVPFEIEGELLGESDAPRLWERIRALAARVGTAPPDHVVAGIDTNFFVTEAPCTVGGRPLAGRTLFVSIPLLRVLETDEADAVLAHELAHLGGGDTRESAALGPRLQQFDAYTWKMRTGALTVVAHYLLRLYRMIFEFALARDSRERETNADRVAARLVSPGAIAQSLVKISAYASYRSDVERQLFSHDRQYDGQLGIAHFVASGLPPYAASPAFVAAMRTGNVPHPYDRHPPLPERMQAVGHVVAEAEYGSIVQRAPQATWVDDVPTAQAIEARLWSQYEQLFSERHALSLAYRYEPANDDERAVVLRHFPPLDFAVGTKGDRVAISIAGLATTVDGKPTEVPWDDVRALAFDNGSATLVVTHHEKGLLTAKKTKIKLRKLGKQQLAYRDAVGRYWRRHQIMRAEQQARRADAG